MSGSTWQKQVPDAKRNLAPSTVVRHWSTWYLAGQVIKPWEVSVCNPRCVIWAMFMVMLIAMLMVNALNIHTITIREYCITISWYIYGWLFDFINHPNHQRP